MSSKMSISFSRKEIKVFDENIPGFSGLGLHWEPNGSRSK